MKKNLIFLSILTILIAVLAACGGGEEENSEKDSVTEVHIGYFPNMTHISSIVALEKGYFDEQFGDDIQIATSTFNDGSAFMEAMSTNSIDIGTVGPTPALNTYVKNPEHEIIAGAVNGGAVLVVGNDSGINSVEDLKGKKVAVPTFGSTQDVGLMKSLQEANLTASSTGNGDVTTIKQAPADTAALMLKGEIDAAATQEPWGVNIETNGNAKLLLDASEFAWGSESTNTVVTARKSFTSNNPEITKKALKAYTQAVDFINENPEEAIQLFLDHVKGLTGKELSKDEVTKAFARLSPTTDVKEDILKEMATISKDAGYISTDNIEGLVNLSYLEDALKE
ncbi:aliphatic sulfonate ABC transporter substrate-binding protein [Ureibacillus sinduriensis]|uniref:Nitrate ABC transporter substrate-binding protein n=1 Tax=Ureibacillus sinduriensis BLB-1 = JCM 15800 TaxID=1384057 RepID=A0A0A3HZH2_9BACL|nr:aliphatic sulfonate ABC transporter substrate-binding protein [Ureibacillus sinduriensis]KGR77814.1 nitrate ABC transporter substrate-binding protein [Ureibacillus sinduriensis BLB-1 = JCM 15800]